MAKETYTYGKRDLHTRQKRLLKEATNTAKESERVRHQRTRRQQCSPRQKRPTHTAKEAYAHCKRGLRTRQKRPTHTAKEAYAHSQRGLRTLQKRPTHTAQKATQKRLHIRQGRWSERDLDALAGNNARHRLALLGSNFLAVFRAPPRQASIGEKR